MKFAKELDQELVPEWRAKYLNYKTGKKHVKAVSRAIGRANATPSLRRTSDLLPPQATPNLFSSGSPFSQRRNTGASNKNKIRPADLTAGQTQLSSPGPLRRTKTASLRSPLREPINNAKENESDTGSAGERLSLTSSPVTRPQYGSIANASSRVRSPSVVTDGSRVFELPAPALRVSSNVKEPAPPASALQARDFASATNNIKATVPPWLKPKHRSFSMAVGGGSGGENLPAAPTSRGTNFTSPYELTPRQRIRRIFSVASPQHRPMGGLASNAGAGGNVGDNKDDISMRTLDEVRERELEFFRFMDSELDKVETFYKLKEDQAGERLTLLHEQLHEMRNRRIDEIEQLRRRGEEESRFSLNASGDDETPRARRHGDLSNASSQQNELENNANTWDMYQDWIAPMRAKVFRLGPNSKALQKMPQTPRILHQGFFGGGVSAGGDGHRDYVRRPGNHEIPYRTAKRKLKLALQEFYRGLELLKSYAMLNRTAFRKLNKKYDKAVNARPPYRYMNEKVNRSCFVNSTVVDDLIVAVEDLYARYFERGNRKIAVGKLRALNKRPGDESGSAFRNGLLIGVGAVLAIQGTVDGARRLFDPDPIVRTQTSYLMQLYGGYFLMLYLFELFCINCRIWTINKVNYPFIFEFDTRSNLDWRQLSQFPSFFFFVFGLFIWLNFSVAANPRLFLYYPVILIGFTIVLLFFPSPTLWHRSRKWFLYSHWRLFFAGLYPVEFRDFFMGDMYCSMTYSMSNIELFFCLYANSWTNPSQCNSSHSRLLGFFSTLPPVWRLLQCIRRYRDTRNVFPHLVNGGKYTMTIASYVTLSLYRIQETHSNLALFITFSTVNSIYTSIWDLFMDFSLLQVDSQNFMLRDILALKRRWIYYLIMVIDPILRFSWIFYAIFTHDTQHNSICSFLVSFAEATRRGMWALIRVENEHCANIAQYKASRDVPLPYHLHQLESSLDQASHPLLQPGDDKEDEDKRPSTAHQIDGTPPMAPNSRKPPVIASGSTRSTKQRDQQQYPSPQKPGTASTADSAWPGGYEHGVPDGAASAEEGTAGRATSTGVSAAAGSGAAGSGSPSLGASDFSTLRRRFTSTLGKSIGVIMAEAHKQDFEKKRKPGVDDDTAGIAAISRPGTVGDIASSDEDDEEDDDAHHVLHEEEDDDDEDDEDEDDVQEVADATEGVGGYYNGREVEVRPTPPASSSTDERTLTGRDRGLSQHSRRHHRKRESSSS
ncbi:Xenotropic and polytropic retrovirus receptor 1 [Sporothrix epigloea]|uniref:Xenotropic and polytropic retrovirus receptor 1 n=1 Tax=Sporothrix epigloea TaxID=1892477 RepID=A0ABP0DWG4_9PEZI